MPWLQLIPEVKLGNIENTEYRKSISPRWKEKCFFVLYDYATFTRCDSFYFSVATATSLSYHSMTSSRWTRLLRYQVQQTLIAVNHIINNLVIACGLEVLSCTVDFGFLNQAHLHGGHRTFVSATKYICFTVPS